jgi:hypothetical protein
MEVIHSNKTDSSLELVGGKGRGLLTLKSLEQEFADNFSISYYANVHVPDFFVVPANMSLSDEQRHIEDEARRLGRLYAVRSSSCLEDNGDNSFDGIFMTVRNVSLEKLAEAIHSVRQSAVSQRAKQYAEEVGVELKESMPVIVQAMVTKQTQTGVVYSTFPCPREILKVIREDCWGYRRRHVTAFRKNTECITEGLDLMSPVIASVDHADMQDKIGSLGLVALIAERRIGSPIIMEFSWFNPCAYDVKFEINPLQARRLTKISDALKFSAPQLQEKGLVASTFDLNGVGDFTGEAFVIPFPEDLEKIDARGLEEFDRRHSNGYVFVAPFLQFFNTSLDMITSNKRAVIAYTFYGKHHDMEISRKKGILYLNVRDSLSEAFHKSRAFGWKGPIETGDIVRATSDGGSGYVFNLSRTF